MARLKAEGILENRWFFQVSRYNSKEGLTLNDLNKRVNLQKRITI